MTKAIEVNDVAPTSLSHIIGQRNVVEQLQVALDAAFADNKKLDDCMFSGGPGLGKSALANVLACEMASGFHELLAQSVSNIGELNAVLLAAKDKDVVFLDEIHELKPELQTTLYLALDKRKVFINGGKTIQSIPLANFTLILATTDPHKCLAPLRSRMKLYLELTYLSADELALVVLQRSRALGWPLDDDVPPLIGQRSKGTPRLALRLLQSARRVCRSEGDSTITVSHLQRACELEQLDEIGLGPSERRYLEILSQGSTRLNVIGSTLGLAPATITEVIEPFLIRSGLVTKDKNSLRQLTSEGWKHIQRDKHDEQ